MPEAIVADLFVEDHAQEEFISALTARLSRERGIDLELRVRCARGGRGRAIAELKVYQATIGKGFSGLPIPDALVVAIDANCNRFSEARKEIQEALDVALRDRTAIACPEPHIERWYLADLESFEQVIGSRPGPHKRKCERDLYKRILSKAIVKGGNVPMLGGIEFARELVERMDLYRAGRAERSLKAFVDMLNSVFAAP
jgi:hypothetical protein